jgi:hypothetical protein
LLIIVGTDAICSAIAVGTAVSSVACSAFVDAVKIVVVPVDDDVDIAGASEKFFVLVLTFLFVAAL